MADQITQIYDYRNQDMEDIHDYGEDALHDEEEGDIDEDILDRKITPVESFCSINSPSDLISPTPQDEGALEMHQIDQQTKEKYGNVFNFIKSEEQENATAEKIAEEEYEAAAAMVRQAESQLADAREELEKKRRELEKQRLKAQIMKNVKSQLGHYASMDLQPLRGDTHPSPSSSTTANQTYDSSPLGDNFTNEHMQGIPMPPHAIKADETLLPGGFQPGTYQPCSVSDPTLPVMSTEFNWVPDNTNLPQGYMDQQYDQDDL